MGTKFYGITAAQNPDNAGETLYIDGLDITRLDLIKDEHPQEESFFTKVGAIVYKKKIYSETDCESDKQLRCWRHAQVPMVYVEGELADDTDHPNAKSSAELLKFSKRPGIPLDIGLSIDGGVLERKDTTGQITEDEKEGKQLTRTIGMASSLTVKPCNSKCVTFLDNDLTKSDLAMSPPVGYAQALQKSQAMKSIKDVLDLDMRLLVKMTQLQKSLKDYFGGFTGMQCKKCGQAVRFFKSGNDIPHRCSHCNSPFSLNRIWQALNK